VDRSTHASAIRPMMDNGSAIMISIVGVIEMTAMMMIVSRHLHHSGQHWIQRPSKRRHCWTAQRL